MRNPYYSGPCSDHFDGTRFFHPGLPSSDKSLVDLLRWKILGKRIPWPKLVPAREGLRPAARVADLQITHIGHATYLVQTGNQNILVDPVWADRASPVPWAGPRRHNPPAVAFNDLPPIDLVLVTHNHYDHMDTDLLEKLWKAHRPRIITPLGNDTILQANDTEMRVETGDWWKAFSIATNLQVTIVPAYHWSSRSMRDQRMALWGGFLLQTPAGVIYCAGDTAYRDGAIFPEIRRRFGDPVVAILPIGAYAPRWFMQTQHADPKEALQIARALGARQALGVHWGTFALTDERFDEPPAYLETARSESEMGDLSFLAMRPGDIWRA